jgi:Na+/melibiose symporter-like transporter
MKTQFKDVPWDVYVAAVFLILMWATICFYSPVFGLTFTAVTGTLLSIARVLHYLSNGN